MSLADIDAVTTRRRIQDVADDTKKVFEAHARRSAEIDAAAREAAAKEEADLKAVLQRKAEAEAARAAAEQPEQPEAEDKPKPRPKPSTLSLGAEEFKLDRQARQAAEEARPEPAPPAPPKTEPAPAKEAPARRTMKLGADDDMPRPDKPVRRRPPRPEADDDMSGRTWLR